MFPKKQTLNKWKCIALRTASTMDAPAGPDCSHQPVTILPFNPPLQPLPISSSSLGYPGHRSTACIINFMFPCKKAAPKAWGQEPALEFGGEGCGWKMPPPPLPPRDDNPNTAMLNMTTSNHGPTLTAALPPYWAPCSPGPCLCPRHIALFSNTPSCMLWLCLHLWEEGGETPSPIGPLYRLALRKEGALWVNCWLVAL